MKQILLLLHFAFYILHSLAQNVGIGTSTPNALLHVKNATSGNIFSGSQPATMIVEDSGNTILHIAGNTGSSFERTGIRISEPPYRSDIYFYGPNQQLNIGVLGRNQLVVHNNGMMVHNQLSSPSLDNSALLQLTSANRGVLLPRLSIAARQAIPNPSTSLLLYQTDNDSGFYYNAATPAAPEWSKLLTTTDQLFDRVDSISLLRNHRNYNDNFLFGRNLLPPDTAIVDNVFFFNKSKGAFRAGSIGSDAWAPQNIGFASFATGIDTRASGFSSFAGGQNTIALGEYSFATGLGTVAKTDGSFVVGEYNDTSQTFGSTGSANEQALFTIGNGINSTNRRNVFSVLRGGQVGINKIIPSGFLRATGTLNIRSTDFGEKQIVLENALDFTNQASITYQDRHVIFQNTDNGGSFWDFKSSTGITEILLSSNGDLDIKGDLTLGPSRSLGVNTTSPSAPAHIVRMGVSGGSFNANSVAILESNDHGYLQFSNPDNKEAGILSGNVSTGIRSSVIFNTDSSLAFSSGGKTTRAVISKTGEMGIGTTTPAAKLDVNGKVKLGTNGTILASVIKVTVNKDVPPIAAGGTSFQNFTVTNATLGGSVIISPSGTLNAGIVIGSARVINTNLVEVRFINTSGIAIDIPAMDFYVTVVQ